MSRACSRWLSPGGASAHITDRENLVTGHDPQPGHIWVYDFAATPADVPADSALAGQPDLDTTPQTADQVAEGKKLGAQIAAELIADIQKLGMPAAAGDDGNETANQRPGDPGLSHFHP